MNRSIHTPVAPFWLLFIYSLFVTLPFFLMMVAVTAEHFLSTKLLLLLLNPRTRTCILGNNISKHRGWIAFVYHQFSNKKSRTLEMLSVAFWFLQTDLHTHTLFSLKWKIHWAIIGMRPSYRELQSCPPPPIQLLIMFGSIFSRSFSQVRNKLLKFKMYSSWRGGPDHR